MGKYAKIALVLLYAAQIVIAFREQLVHLYKDAVEQAHRVSAPSLTEMAPGGDVRLKRATQPRYNPHEILVAAPHLPAVLAIGFEGRGSEDGEEHHYGDEHKDKVRKHRTPRPVEYLIRNLFHDIRQSVARMAASDEVGSAAWKTLYPNGAAHAA